MAKSLLYLKLFHTRFQQGSPFEHSSSTDHSRFNCTAWGCGFGAGSRATRTDGAHLGETEFGKCHSKAVRDLESRSQHVAGQDATGSASGQSIGAQIVCRGLSGPSIGHNLERDLLSLIETVHPGAFDRADMHEDVLAAVVRLNEAESFLIVEPFHGSGSHSVLPWS